MSRPHFALVFLSHIANFDNSNWQGWLLYFVHGVARQAGDAVQRAERINELLSGWRSLAAQSTSKFPARCVDPFSASLANSF